MMRHGASSGYVRSKLTMLHGGAGRTPAAEFDGALAVFGGPGGGICDRAPPRAYPRYPHQALRGRQLRGTRQLHPDPQRYLPQMRHLRRDLGVFVSTHRLLLRNPLLVPAHRRVGIEFKV
jgi:hypothetical protein